MSIQLKADEMLDALITLNHPRASDYQSILCAVSTAMANDLGTTLGCWSGPATFQGMAFAGLCAPFGPTYHRQPCPEVLAALDPGGDQDWQEEAEAQTITKEA